MIALIQEQSAHYFGKSRKPFRSLAGNPAAENGPAGRSNGSVGGDSNHGAVQIAPDIRRYLKHSLAEPCR